MKNLFIVAAFAVASLSIVACNNRNKTSSATATDSTASPKMASADVKTKPGVDAKAAESVKGLVADSCMSARNDYKLINRK